MLLLAADFYYTKNIAGRRLVGLRWWNEVDAAGTARWVFESSEPGTKTVNPTDSRFFWLAMYVQPVVWVVMAILAFVRLQFLWVPLVVIALVLTIMNTLAFSRCDKFSQASNLAGSAFSGGNLAGSIASSMVGSWFSRS
ncbi:related to TVP23 - integral membrane protein localized to vesicles along with the v-SNARE [Cephalotrichum gorgonifer]|uniref:Golgi apparatus membrane protein TVP23 n=1 Tax=Cephalotrichum gorgonifer TaxID=2041049 RepID=A0AAE8MPK7_9PEZI|nr:related to TVP23 - integral membrane protein localized to vesicles along with the v-SNARE [Cephalotrichum gorgonifer]